MRPRPISAVVSVVVSAALFAGAAAHGKPPAVSSADLRAFQAALDSLAAANHLPGFSAAIVRDGKVVWSHGFGYADLERKRRAAPDTPYRLASLSKPIAATLIMLLVEQGKLDLETPMRSFAIHAWFEPGGGSWAHYPSRYEEKPITVRHVLTHTSEADPPGDAYKYNGNLFADLTWVIEDVTKTSYPVAVRDRILAPLRMKRTLPGQMAPWGQDVAAQIATPYVVKDGHTEPGTYPGYGLDPDEDVTRWNLKPAYRTPAVTTAERFSARRSRRSTRRKPRPAWSRPPRIWHASTSHTTPAGW